MNRDENKIPEGWSIENLVSNLDSLIDYRGKTPEKSDSGVLTLSAKSVKMGFIDYSQAYYISNDTYKSFMTRGIPKLGDILMTTEAPLGCIAKLNREGVGIAQRLLTLRGKEGVLDNDFLMYYLTSAKGQHQLKSRASGSTVEGIKRTEFDKVVILMPKNIEEQKSIASVLSAFDDKIELLQAQNKTLEALAQTVFQEWFGKYQIGDELPEGWRVGKLGETGRIICGKTPLKSNKDYFENDVPFIKIPDMHNQVFIIYTSDNLSFDGAKSQQNKMLPKNSICISCIATVGLVSITTRDSQTNQQINSIIPNSEFLREFLYLKLVLLNKHLNDLGSGGTATLNVNTTTFSNIEIIMPDRKTLIDFHTIQSPLFNKILSNLNQIETLSQTRDELLPKLMSGALRVQH